MERNESCIFCKIIRGEIPSEKLYEDGRMIIIRDIEPKAKIHYLAIPKKHYAYLSDMEKSDKDDLGVILGIIPTLSKKLGLENGYRLIINQGSDAGQTVPHLHIHILGGQELPFTKL